MCDIQGSGAPGTLVIVAERCVSELKPSSTWGEGAPQSPDLFHLFPMHEVHARIAEHRVTHNQQEDINSNP
jgi:hypothetical protein